MTEMHRLPDGSGFFVASTPLPKDHWIYDAVESIPPMPLRMRAGEDKNAMKRRIQEVARYAIRASTMRGKEMDFDPDAMVQNFVVGMLGYNTEDGLSGESFGDPYPVPPEYKP